MDAPYHFNKNGRKLDQIPLEDLIDIPGVMIDIYSKVHVYTNGNLTVVENYALTKEDIMVWEKANGQIPPRAVVLLQTGWGTRYPNEMEYKGLKINDESDAQAAEASRSKTEQKQSSNGVDLTQPLNFPGFSKGAASFLTTERNVLGVGIDTLSIDIGADVKFPAHGVFATKNVYMIENVGNLHLLPPKGFRLWMLPFKIDQGTGAPVRVVAQIDSNHNSL